MPNQILKQIARDERDKQLIAYGWVIHKVTHINFNVGLGIAVTEYITDVRPGDFVLFVHQKADWHN